MDTYEKVFKNFIVLFHDIKEEGNRELGLRLCRLYLNKFHKDVIAPLTSEEERNSILLNQSFIPAITTELGVHLTDYFENVKEEAQLLMLSIAQRFLPPQTALSKPQMDLVQVLRAGMTQGWPNSLNTQLKDAAKMESEMLSYVFENASSFVSVLITTYMDESYGRDNLIRFLKLLNESAPFLLLNDFRVAKQQKALRKAEVLGQLMQ